MISEGKEIQVVSTHAFMLLKVLSDDIEPEGHFNWPQPESCVFIFKRANSLQVSLRQHHHANTLTHKLKLHFEGKKLRAEANEGRREN